MPYVTSWERRAKKEGLREGKREGKREGLREGKREGLREGKREGKLEMARNLLKKGVPLDIIVKSSRLKASEIALLQEPATE